MKKYIALTALIMVILVVSFAFSYDSAQTVRAIGPIIRSGSNVASMNSTGVLSANATTTNLILRNQVGVATSTMTFSSESLDAVALNLRVFVPVQSNQTNKSFLKIQPQSSDDGVDWYDYDNTMPNEATVYTATTTINLASTTVFWSYWPATIGATTTKAVNFPLIPARFTRFILTVGTTTAVTVQDEFDVFVNIIGKVSSTVR